ncbi:MAG: hypothetical protein G01um10142_526, partial [Parcubacteria group bacterium Gr01-1014_2]
MRQNIIAGIDIGNSTIKTVIAELKEESGKPQILGIGLS